MYLLFDIGGTKMRIAVSSDGKTLGEPKIIPTMQNFDEGIQIIAQTANELSGGGKIEAAAGGLAGTLDKDRTMLISSPNIKGWITKPFKQNLENILNCPVHLENDADLAALGEAVYGAGSGKNIVAYLTISTGVGGGRVVNGKIDENSLGFEPGHQIIVPDGDPCNCGGKGHLGSYVSGSGLERIHGKKGEDITDEQVWNQVAKYLAVGLNNTVVHWSPDIVILGGSVMKSIPLEKVKSYLRDYLTIFPNPPEIILSKLGDSVGLYGALKLLQSS